MIFSLLGSLPVYLRPIFQNLFQAFRLPFIQAPHGRKEEGNHFLGRIPYEFRVPAGKGV
jgi:hypothetical protein